MVYIYTFMVYMVHSQQSWNSNAPSSPTGYGVSPWISSIEFLGIPHRIVLLPKRKAKTLMIL